MANCLVLTGFGINCEQESLAALKLAGAKKAEIVHISEIISGDKRIKDYQFIIFPGGFLDGDDLGSAKVQVNRFKFSPVKDTRKKLIDELFEFVDSGNIALGICNGFQFMIKAGILPGELGARSKGHSTLNTQHPTHSQVATLSFNDSGRFEDRWTYLTVNPKSPCVFTKGLDKLYLPVRHGEGKLICDAKTLAAIKQKNAFAMQYSDEKFKPTMSYPDNPNGSLFSIAGLCDKTGRLFGLMPHPEAFVFKTNHPRWTREKTGEPDGLKIFKNAIKYLKQV
jgi:phosphoribosylformylglycinamidine synthase I